MFRHVIEYLRGNEHNFEELSECKRRALLHEAEFYKLGGLVSALSKVDHPSRRTAAKTKENSISSAAELLPEKTKAVDEYAATAFQQRPKQQPIRVGVSCVPPPSNGGANRAPPIPTHREQVTSLPSVTSSQAMSKAVERGSNSHSHSTGKDQSLSTSAKEMAPVVRNLQNNAPDSKFDQGNLSIST
jgi:hypothetical protein